MIHCFKRKKIIDLVTRRAALRGRKSRQGEGGEIIKGYGTIYTPGWDSSWIVASRVREKPGYATEFLMKMIPKAGRQNEGDRKNDGETE